MRHWSQTRNARFALALAACLLVRLCVAQAQPQQPPGQVMGASGRPAVEDTYSKVNWKGPAVLAYGFYDRLPIHQAAEFSDLLIRGKAFVGRVKPHTVTPVQAIALGRQALAKNGVVLPAKAMGSSPQGRNLFALQSQAAAELMGHRTLRALGFLMLAYESAPKEPAIILNLASVFAAVGLPNEAIAFLDELDRLGGLPTGKNFVSPKAVAIYVRGYSEMLCGNLPKAKELLARARQLDPFLRESALALALAQAQSGEMEEARKTYSLGVWRRVPAKVVIQDKSESGDKTVRTAAPGSAEAAAAEDLTVPLEEAFDLSGGKEGILPVYRFPRDIAEVYAMQKKMETRLEKESRGVLERTQEAAALAPSIKRVTARGDWILRYNTMIGMTKYRDPHLAPLYFEYQAVDKEFHSELSRLRKRQHEQIRQASASYKHVPCSVWLDIGNQAVGSFNPTAQQFDVAARRYYRLWYRLTTALVGQVGPGVGQEYISLSHQADVENEWARLDYMLTKAYISFIPDDLESCAGNRQFDLADAPRAEKVDACPDSLRGKSVEFEIEAPFSEGLTPKLSLEFTCESVTFGAGLDLVHVDAGPVEFGAGPFGEVEIEREGEVTIFVGGAAGATVGPESGNVKAGGYVKVGHEGIKDVGIKSEAESKISAKIGGATAGVKGKEELFNVSFVPSVPEPPRGPMLKQFGTSSNGGD